MAKAGRTRRWRTLAGGLAVVGLAIAAVVFRHSLPGPAEIWRTVVAANSWWLALAAGAEVASLVAFALQQRRLLTALGGAMSLIHSLDMTLTRTAISVTFPAGSVVSTGFAVQQFRKHGASTGAAAAVAALTGFQSVASLNAIYLVWFAALGVATTSPGRARGVLLVTMIVLVAVSTPYVLRLVRRRLDHALGGPPPGGNRPRGKWIQAIDDLIVDSLRAAVSLPARDWALGSGAAAANWLLDLACLMAVARACGLQVSTIALVGGYLAVQIVRQIPLTPGGVGLIEASLLAALIAAGGTSATATAVVLLYRLLSCWLIVVAGLPAWFGLRFDQDTGSGPGRRERRAP